MDNDIQEEFNKVNGQFALVNKRMDKVVGFLQTQVALKSDLEEFVTKTDLKIEMKDLHNKLDKIIYFQESHRKDHVVIDHRLERLESKTGIV